MQIGHTIRKLFARNHKSQRPRTPRRSLQVECLEGRHLLSAAPADPIPLTSLGDVLFFAADDGVHGRELWRSDGTPGGTMMVADVAPGSPGSDIRMAQVLGNHLFFVANDGTTGLELWKLDLTTGQHSLVRDIYAGSEGSLPVELTVFNNELYFSALSETHGRELWKTNGTTAGTSMVVDLEPGSLSSSPDHLTVFAGELVFSASGAIKSGRKQTKTGTELWKTNGTAAGTVLLKDMAVGTASSFPADLTVVNGKLFFTAFGSTGSGKNVVQQGNELWVTNGTPQGTTLVKDIFPGTGSSNPSFLTNVDGTLYFAAQESAGKGGLWKSDGTSAGTQRVLDRQVIEAIPSGEPLPVAAGKIFFHSIGTTGDLELFAYEPATSNLTSIRSVLPKDAIETGVEVSLSIVNFGGTIYFSAFDPGSGLELWKLDPVTLEPELLIDIFPGNQVGNPSPFRLFGLSSGRFFFVADDGVHGRELWFSDGTTAGTRLVADIK